MNLKHLNLDLYGIPEDAEIQIPVFLISEDLKARKLINGLLNIGCDTCFCVGELCDLVLAYAGFEERPGELYDFYFGLLDRYCEEVSHENDRPVKEALKIYGELMRAKERLRVTNTESEPNTKEFLKGVGSRLCSLRKDQKKDLDTVARVLSITPAALVRIERGDCDVRPDLLSRICDYYNVTVADFFRDVENSVRNQ
jgi:DNA-binding XRE family transcriptional regulator